MQNSKSRMMIKNKIKEKFILIDFLRDDNRLDIRLLYGIILNCQC